MPAHLHEGTRTVKALSIRQPWLWAILDIPESDCPKRVENRKGTAFHYRGPVLLHASLGGTRLEYTVGIGGIMRARIDHQHTASPSMDGNMPVYQALPRGCYLGIARIVDVVMHPPAFVRGALTSGYCIAGQLGLKLADVRKLPRVDAPGSLGLYNVEHTPGQVGRRPMWVNFGEHRDAYAAAWAELSAKGGAT